MSKLMSLCFLFQEAIESESDEPVRHVTVGGTTSGNNKINLTVDAFTGPEGLAIHRTMYIDLTQDILQEMLDDKNMCWGVLEHLILAWNGNASHYTIM